MCNERLYKTKQYNELYEIVKQEKTENNFQLKEDKQFLIWHEAIAIFYVNKSIKLLLNLLNNALKLTVTNGDFYRKEK